MLIHKISKAQAESIINKNYKTLLAMQSLVEIYLERSGYRHVDLSKLLSQASIF